MLEVSPAKQICLQTFGIEKAERVDKPRVSTDTHQLCCILLWRKKIMKYNNRKGWGVEH